MRSLLGPRAPAWRPPGCRLRSWQPPSDSQRCPSKWGAGDERGSGNHMKPETVLRAARLIKTGEVFELGRVLSESMPLPAGRRFEILTKRTRNDPGTQSSWLERGAGRLRDRSGRNAVRHLQPPDDRLEHVQLLQARRDGEPHRLHEAWRAAGGCARHARRPDRRRRAQAHADARRDLRDHAAGSAAGARGAEADAAARRCRAHSHRLGHAVGQGQRALSAREPGDRHGGRRMAREAGPDAGRRGQRRRRDLAEPGQTARRSGSPDHARRQRHSPARESSPRRARRAARSRVRADRRAAQDSGRHRDRRSPQSPSGDPEPHDDSVDGW